MTDKLEDFKKNRKTIKKVREAIENAYSPDANERLKARSDLQEVSNEMGTGAVTVDWNDDTSVGQYLTAINLYVDGIEETFFNQDSQELVGRLADGKLAKLVAQLPRVAKEGSKKLEDYMTLASEINEVLSGKKEYKDALDKLRRMVNEDIDKRHEDNEYVTEKARKAIKSFMHYALSDPSVGRDYIQGHVKEEQKEFEEKYSEGERADMSRSRLLKLVEDKKTREFAASQIERLAA